MLLSHHRQQLTHRINVKCQMKCETNLRHKCARHIWQCHRFLLFTYQTDLKLGLFVRSIETREGATCVNGWELRARQPSKVWWESNGGKERDFFGLENIFMILPVADHASRVLTLAYRCHCPRIKHGRSLAVCSTIDWWILNSLAALYCHRQSSLWPIRCWTCRYSRRTTSVCSTVIWLAVNFGKLE